MLARGETIYPERLRAEKPARPAVKRSTAAAAEKPAAAKKLARKRR
jgi:hypothetical protein